MSKTSVQNAVLQRSMSDEEKTASLKIVSNEPDEFSAMFETALENADIEKVQTLNREFDSARINFFQSQILESGDSGNEESSGKEEKPPDLPLTIPPVSSSQYDSGFPSKDFSVKSSVSDNVESQNVVTKESVVKARMRLFENDIKADVNSEQVPLSPKASIPVSIKNVDNSLSEVKNDTKHRRLQESHVISDKDIHPKKQFTSSISFNLSKNDTDVITHSQEDTDVEAKPQTINISDSSSSPNNSVEVISIEDSLESSTSKIDEALEIINSTIISLEDSSEPSGLSKFDLPETPESPKQHISIQSSSEQNETRNDSFNDFSYIDDVEIVKNNTEEIPQRLEDSSSSEANKFSFVENELEVIDENKETLETVNYNVKVAVDNDPKIEEKVESVNYNVKLIEKEDKIIETVNYSVKVSQTEPVEAVNTFVQSDTVTVPEKAKESVEKPSSKVTHKPILEKKESYPDDLNPFDDEDDNKDEASLNPFGSDDEDEEKSLKVYLRKPIPSPRFKKKISVSGTTNSPMKDASFQRVSVNPFESDNDDDDDEDKPPVPATRRKKISVPKFSMNPWTDDEDDDKSEEVAKKPVPLPRDARTSSRLSEIKSSQPNSLSISHHFGGSNSSISSGSYYGSARKKRPAPKPPIPAFLDGSNNSSVTSTPSHSVPHSPKTTPKYRKDRKAPPPPPKFTSTPNPSDKNEEKASTDDLHKEKTVKDEVNRNLQINEDPGKLSVFNKSTFGKWKRKKGLAPSKPVPQRRTLKCLPMAEIKKELEFIEIQQQGLEKQGVRLEQIIREKCEGTTDNGSANQEDDIPIEVDDLILQLFELVNEKNELFRKQTELMYLRRQQRLEEEHADIEYQIRCLMMQPEANKTDSDKAREEELIQRLVEIVERRNEIVECLEKDRVREAEEDDSISNHINLFTLSRDNLADKELPTKTEKSKKEKKKEKSKGKEKKKSKHKSKEKVDVDKDVDETETSMNTMEKKKKKKFNLF